MNRGDNNSEFVVGIRELALSSAIIRVVDIESWVFQQHYVSGIDVNDELKSQVDAMRAFSSAVAPPALRSEIEDDEWEV